MLGFAPHGPSVGQLAPLVLVAVGLVCLLLPDTVRRYDQGMTRFIKDRDEYVATVRFLGSLLALGGLAAFFMLLFGIMR